MLKNLKLLGAWTIIVMSNAHSPVVRLKLPKLLIVLNFAVILLLIAFLTNTYFSYKEKEEENIVLKQKLTTSHEVNQDLSERQDRLERQANSIGAELEQLLLLKEQVKSVISSMNPNTIANEENSEGTGGPEQFPQDVNNTLGITSIDDTGEQFSQIQKVLPSLKQSYKSAINNSEETKEKLKRIPTLWPTSSDRITSQFGNRKDPFTKRTSHHSGIDIAGPSRTPIYAAADGEVILAKRNGGHGKMIIIDHSNTYKTSYSHLAGYNVNKGDTVEKGDLIGFMGSTGRSTGVHLHYQILKDNEPIDPYPYMTFLND